MTENKISILMGIYNCSATLSESIDSILSQSFKDWELIMCDDGSSDNTKEIAEHYERLYPEKIKVIWNETNRGLSYALNKCFENSNGFYLARQDGDDLSAPQRMQILYSFLENNPEFSIVSSSMIHFDESGEWGRSEVISRPQKSDFILGTPFCHAASMFTREAFFSVGKYSDSNSVLRVEDYDLWSKMYSKGYIGANISEPLYKMRDDRNAFLRRKFKYRINEANALYNSYGRLGIKYSKYIYILKPLIVGILPERIYRYLHKRKLRNRGIAI